MAMRCWTSQLSGGHRGPSADIGENRAATSRRRTPTGHDSLTCAFSPSIHTNRLCGRSSCMEHIASQMTRSIPPRVHVLFARDSSAAIVIRRGPSRHTAVIGWDRRTDRFKLGQWFYGRIYERRCDMSTDGMHMIYFADHFRSLPIDRLP
jgi:hypothetical protein